ncbi:hypothetical protein DFH94DRAFT_461462 [Russula ochroleuca]|jgi:hypothetical protein|uniref:Uncharacterized protein n=1 Tax=Russula ochroleuca TaxID=152965 RepID=A0A9P5MVT3_9AGAM|nr:hypothetical protein DFH94DRAFT_461462 [Russula ochroleuca]
MLCEGRKSIACKRPRHLVFRSDRAVTPSSTGQGISLFRFSLLSSSSSPFFRRIWNLDITGEDLSSELKDSPGSSEEYRTTGAKSQKRSRNSARPVGAQVRLGKLVRRRGRPRPQPCSDGSRCLHARARKSPPQRRESLQASFSLLPWLPEEVAKRRHLCMWGVNAAATEKI